MEKEMQEQQETGSTPIKKGRPMKRSATPSTQVTDAYVNYVVEYYLAAADECGYDEQWDEDNDDEDEKSGTFTQKPSLRAIARELNISNTKLKKLLITGGVYDFGSPDSEERIRKILYYHSQGKAVSEICELVGLKKSAVESSLPYEKAVYTAKKADWMDTEKRSLNAERCERYRKSKKKRDAKLTEEREAAVEGIVDSESLWKTLMFFEGYPFRTAKNLSFTYKIKGNEMFVDRKEKSITRATVELAYRTAVDMDGIVAGPKKLRCFGASYLYPVFIRLGVIRDIKTEKNVDRNMGKDME